MASNISNESFNCMFLDTNQQPFKYISIANIVSCILNAIFAFIATFSNAVILVSIWKSPSLRTPTNLLLCCIAFTDFLVGAVVQPLDVVQRIMEETQNFKMYCSFRLAKNSIAWIISSVSFCILTTIAVERLVALVKPLHYTTLVTQRTVLALVVSYWLLCSVFIWARFAGLENKTFFGIALFFIFINLTINVVSYYKIFQVIKLQQKRILDEANLSARLHGQMNQTDIRRFKTFTLTVVYVLVLIFLFYIPFICYLVAYSILGFIGPVKLAYVCIETFSYINSSINPFVFSYRLRCIRQAVGRIMPVTVYFRRNIIHVN